MHWILMHRSNAVGYRINPPSRMMAPSKDDHTEQDGVNPAGALLRAA
jgi:hypothetical protein